MAKEVESEPFFARRAEPLDSEGVQSLFLRSTGAVFGRSNIDNIIERANLAITLAGKEDEVLAFAAYFDHPVVDGVDPALWEQWLHSNYMFPQANPLNSLFLRLFVARQDFAQGALTELIRSAFVAVPLLQFVFLPVPNNQSIGPALESLFSRVPLSDSEKEEKEGFSLYATLRHQHYPVLHVRPARVEDNDDLMPIFQQSSEKISQLYGEFFIAELIESQDEDHRTIVAEVGGRAVGFISVTSEVDLSLLDQNFQLEAFHGLRRPSEEDEIKSIHLDSVHPTSLVASSIISTTSHVSQLQHSSGTSISQATDSPKSATVPTASTSNVTQVEQETKQQESRQEREDHKVSSPAPEREYILRGRGVALMVQLFCIQEQYEMRSVDLLPAVFQLFPDHDYLILTQPHIVPEFPLLQHFSQVSSRATSTFPHELYVMHKCSLLQSLAVSPMRKEHENGVRELVAALSASADILVDVQHYLEAGRDPLFEGAAPLHVLVVECLEQVVGVVVLRQEQDLLFLRSHYCIEDFVYHSQHAPSEHLHLHHLLLSPAFIPHTKHVLKETLRLTHSNNLYYPLSHTSQGAALSHSHSVSIALREMVPVRPRRQTHYPDGMGINSPLSPVLEKPHQFSLYHTNRKLSLEPKITVNARVVVVGASDTALACLETLVFSSHLHFTNLILVSPYGLDCSKSQALPHSWTDRQSLLGLQTWVTAVRGKMSAINRTKQTIWVQTHSQETVLPYDYLLLCTGSQFQLTQPVEGTIPEQGLLTFESSQQAEHVMDWVKSKMSTQVNRPLLVYGSSLAAYTVIQALLNEQGLPGDRVVLAQPCPSLAINNPQVEQKIHQALKDAGVEIMEGTSVHSYCSSEGVLTAVRLVNVHGDHITVPCQVMISVDSKHVDVITFQAVNDACLVFDHRLVVDLDHNTNDPHILAAGPLTKFSRGLYADDWTHEQFNSQEVGRKLAETVLCRLDPTHHAESNPANSDLIPQYTQPRVYHALLPGNLHYFHVEKPSLREPLLQAMAHANYGQELVTESGSGYFRLHVNQYSRVETITVASTQPFPASNYLCLYNLHEKYLNNLVCRYREDLITDFFQFFDQEWALAVFHDRFHDFVQEVKDIVSSPETGMKSKVSLLVEDEPTVSVSPFRSQLSAEFASSGVLRSSLTQRLHRYLHYNHYHLPVYARPDMI